MLPKTARTQVPDSTRDSTKLSWSYLILQPPGLVKKVNPPLIYKKWWKEVEKCSGLYIPRSQQLKVEWYSINANVFLFSNDTSLLSVNKGYLGYTWSEMNIIFIADPGGTGWGMDDEDTIKHEMLHYLMYHNGLKPGHPKALYDKCHIWIERPAT